MSYYRKKPVVIEAVQWTGENEDELKQWAGNNIVFDSIFLDVPVMVSPPFVRTLEGNMKISLGDYIIKGVDGEFYPCKPDIFEKTYDLVEGG